MSWWFAEPANKELAAIVMSAVLCDFCQLSPTIQNSHVVPNFVGKHIKANSPSGYLLNTWMAKPQYDIIKGPYLCAKCDNETFSSWETFYSANIFRRPIEASSEWGSESTIQFALSLAYRYALHFLQTSPMPRNRPYTEQYRARLKAALQNPAAVGTDLYVYPYVHKAIENYCGLSPGVNHLLQLAIHGECLPQEGDLPNSMLVIIPNAIFLYCDSDLSASCDNEIQGPVTLSVGSAFDARRANGEMPIFLKTILNRLIGHGQNHQKQLGRWKTLAYGADKFINPKKLCYVAHEQDKQLAVWQHANCR